MLHHQGMGNLIINPEVAIMNPTELPEELEQKLQTALLQAAQDINSPDIGVSVGVVTPDVTWTGATGISNLETQQATQTDDLFNIASISKSYTSAIILKLQEQRKLSLDDTIDNPLPEIAVNITNGENLTIRQILNGTGGLWDYFNGNDEFLSDLIADYLSGSNRDWQPEELVAYAFGKPLFSGGGSSEVWTYTNTGNIIAALIAEEATGKPFKEILAEEILSPLELNNTFFTTEDVSLEQRARGYEDIFTADGTIGADGILEDYSIVNTEIVYGAGSIVSSAEDVARFFDSLASGDLLQPESTAEIFNYVDTGFGSEFGLGVFSRDYPWGETRRMSGDGFGYISNVDYFLNSDTTISVLVNQNSTRSELVRLAYIASIANSLGLNDDSAINGTEADDYLTGTSNNDLINGKEGDDIIIGKKGLDAIDGGVGDDLIEGGEGDDVLFGKEGDDNLYGGQDNDFLNGGVGDDLLKGNRGFDNLIGGDGKDTLLGGKDDDILSGGAGDDLIRDTQGNNAFYGNDGDDLLFAGKGDDVLYGDAGSDRLFANAGNDQLFGGSSDDVINGGKGDDLLIGGEGEDTLIGSSGNNILTGDSGSDRFILSKKGTDIITDFTQSEDLLQLPETISFADIEISQGSGDNEDNTFITFSSETLAILNNINSEEISQSDFTDTTQAFFLPKPTGDYAVGTTSYHFIDPDREEIYTEDPNDNREITAKVWYPSVEVPAADTAPYMSQDLSSAVASGLGIPPQDFLNVINSIPTNSVANAPVAEAESEYPVLIFSHGFGDLPELNTIKAEELASHGYVVVAINHTYDSLVNTFPDGRVIPQSPIFGEAQDESELIELLAESIDIRAGDAQFVLDELEQIDAGDDPTGLFSGKLDLDRVGMYGYSLGGATAAKVLSIDPRFQAGINLDGGLLGDVANASLSQPFMFLNNEAFGTGNSPIPELREFTQIQQSFVDNLQNEGYEVTITGTEHSNFNDLPLIGTLLVNSGIELGVLEEILNPDPSNNQDFEPINPQLGAQIINDYTLAFFEQHLNNQESPLLTETSSPYPEVIFQSYNLDSPPSSQFGTVNGDVLEIDSSSQLVFAGSGNDLIDASASLGNNRIYAGDGDDTLILGTGDRIIAGSGSDRFFTGSGGDNSLTGGAGADQFWIAVAETPSAPNVVTDYNPIEDVIGIAGLGIRFDELNLTQQGDDVLIQATDSDLAIFQGITTDSLGADNFVFT